MDITAKEIIRIISACKRSGVKELKLGNLELKFGTGDADQVSVETRETVITPTDHELKMLKEQSDKTDLLDAADEELAHMQVENPALFEELLVSRELEYSGPTAEDGY